MELSVSFMSNVIGILALLLYMCAPFLHDAKRAFYARLLSELLFGMMFFYIGCLAGTVYYVFMILSGLFEKQIEHNAIFSLLFGVAGCGTVIFFNNNGAAGIILGISLILVFIHINDQKMMTTSAFMDVLTALAMLYYSISVRSITGIVFAVILVLIAMAGLFSAVRLVKGGGLEAAAAEEALYQKQQQKKKQERKTAEKTKQIRRKAQK